MMNKRWKKRLLAVVLVVTMLFSIVPSETVWAKTVKLSQTSASVKIGKTLQITLINAKGKVTWSSSDKKIATVDKNGKVTGKKTGTVKITAKHKNKAYKCTVKVVKKIIPVKEITLNKKKVTLAVGNTYQLKATVGPENATNQKVTWTSSDDSVVSVKNGKIKALKSSPSSVMITACCGNYTEVCKVVVKEEQSISIYTQNSTIQKGNTEQVYITYSGFKNTDDRSVKWSSSNTGVASINSNGLITAVGPGMSVITATCGEYKAECTISVPGDKMIALSQYTLVMTEGSTSTIKVSSFINFKETDSRSVTWSSDNTSVARVNKGTVTAVKSGSAKITAKCGDCIAICYVTVQGEKYIGIEPASVTLREKESKELKVTFHNFGKNDSKNITWESNSKLVTLAKTTGETNTITAQASTGSAIIKAKSSVGGEVYCVVTLSDESYVTINQSFVVLDARDEKDNTMRTATLSAMSYPVKEGEELTYRWISGNSNIVTVEPIDGSKVNGYVTGKDVKLVAQGAGEADVTVQYGNAVATCKVTVKGVEIVTVTEKGEAGVPFDSGNLIDAKKVDIGKENPKKLMIKTYGIDNVKEGDWLWTLTDENTCLEKIGENNKSKAKTITLVGVKEGTAVIDLRLTDRSNKAEYSKTVAFTVKDISGPTLTSMIVTKQGSDVTISDVERNYTTQDTIYFIAEATDNYSGVESVTLEYVNVTNKSRKEITLEATNDEKNRWAGSFTPTYKELGSYVLGTVILVDSGKNVNAQTQLDTIRSTNFSVTSGL